MQGQDNERGNESANLDFKSSDIKKTNEGELFVNIEGDDERAAAEAEAKAKEEAEAKAKEKEKKRKADAALREERKAAKKAAAEKNKEANRKKHNKISIALGAVAVVILAAVGVITFMAISNRVQNVASEPETEEDVIVKKIQERTTISDEYENNEDYSLEMAFADFDEGIKNAEGADKYEWIISKVQFAIYTAHSTESAWQAWHDACDGDDGNDEYFSYVCSALKMDIEGQEEANAK